eukprot:Platyproteum_vivax@DN14671_c0_g1_i1.p1
MDRIPLSAYGFYATPDIGYNFATREGKPFNYFAFGVACCEVEVDCLTGNHLVVRADIVEDVGESLNPALDIGQIEGAFTQGLGLFTLEEFVYGANGRILTTGPATYKIPTVDDIPRDFRVHLWQPACERQLPNLICSSKGVGEPPLFLASSCFFAIQNACFSAREDFLKECRETGAVPYFRLDSPATSEKIRLACLDECNPVVYVQEANHALSVKRRKTDKPVETETAHSGRVLENKQRATGDSLKDVFLQPVTAKWKLFA